VTQTAPNTANNDTPFVDKDYGGRSTVLLTRNMSFDSSQNGGVVCRDVMRHACPRGSFGSAFGEIK
jgi:hypothetical protein